MKSLYYKYHNKNIVTKSLHITACIILAASTLLIHAQGQEEAPKIDTIQKVDTVKIWNFSGLASINFSQTSFSKNWQAGGESSIAGLGILDFSANYNKNKSSWESGIDMKYGLTKQNGDNSRKTDDIFEFASKYGYKASKKWFYSALFNFKTQMDKGVHDVNRDSVISRFLSPAYITVSIGMDYKPGKAFSLVLAPLTGKITLVNDNEISALGRFGVKPGKKARYEFGGIAKAVMKKEIMKNVTLNSKLSLFSNYSDNPQVDMDWEILVNMKVNQFLSTNLIAQLIYDKDQVDKIQFKEVIGVGITYKLAGRS